MNIFFTSDHHFFHANFLKFLEDDGSRCRPFSSVEGMNEKMVKEWNSVVKDGDRVYHLGDVTFDYSPAFDVLMSRLRGSKRLNLGNHDIIKGTSLIKHFKKVSLWRMFKEHNFICAHVPMNRDQFRKVEFQVHGHTHHHCLPDPHYVNVCVEQNDYRPFHLDEILSRIRSV